MKNLHNIRPILTDRHMAHIWFYKDRSHYITRLMNGVPERLLGNERWDRSWWTADDDSFIMGRWKDFGKPQIDLTMLESIS